MTNETTIRQLLEIKRTLNEAIAKTQSVNRRGGVTVQYQAGLVLRGLENSLADVDGELAMQSEGMTEAA